MVPVLGAAAVFYGWGLSTVGWMNQYYSAVAQSGASNWAAWFFASPGMTDTTATDKPPLAFWPMGIAVRMFGLHPWSVALPQLLETLGTIVLLYLTVRLLAGRLAATVAAVVLATTPVILVLARFDDPDTLLTLLLTAAAYVTVRGARSPARRWAVLLGMLLGLAFLTKWLVAFIPAPALVAVLVRSRLSRDTVGGRWGGFRWMSGDAGRTLATVAGVGALVGLSWVVAVMLTPLSVRPYPDSPHGSILDLVFAQDGVSRLAGSGGPLNGTPGVLRLLRHPLGGQIGWLLPVAVATLVVALVRALRTRRLADGDLLFGGWLVLAGAVFSTVGGAMHAYYTTLLAPPIAALVGLGVARLRESRVLSSGPWPARVGFLALVLGLGAYAVHLLATFPSLRAWAAVVAGAVVVGVLVLVASWAPGLRAGARSGMRRLAVATTAVALLLGPTVFAASTLDHQVGGANPLAGPVETGDGHVPFAPSLVSFLRSHDVPGARWGAAVPTATPASTLQLQLGLPVLTFGGFTGHSGFPSLRSVESWVHSGKLRFLVLAGPFIHGTVPTSLLATPTGVAMSWALRHGCRVHVRGGNYTVLNMAAPLPCRALPRPAR